jgi:retron-type reverse transcriptase
VDKLKPPDKPFGISKQEVWEAYRQVRANQGAPGVDGVTLDEFEKDLKNNLYKIWNRMSSGSYFPPPVKAVEIPKPHGGGTRILGVPTIADRVAQTVVSKRLEAKVEPIFHPDSYGYRPGRSALDAVRVCRDRCWKSDWVIDLDIQKFFDSVDHELMVKAVEAHAEVPWVVLYVKRWLTAPMQLADGTVQQRDRGTPQGSAVSPVLANLFMHYAFDMWMVREFPAIRFERYAMTWSCTVLPNAKPGTWWPRSGTGWIRSGCGCTRTRRRSCIAGTPSGDSIMSGPRSRSWGSPSGPAPRGRNTGSSSPRSSQLSALTPRRGSAGRSAGGGCTAGSGSASPRSRSRSIRSCAVGCSTTERSTAPRCIRSCLASTPT